MGEHLHQTEYDLNLTEVDHLLALRQPDGSYDEGKVRDLVVNRKTLVDEVAIPNAISDTEHEVVTVGRTTVLRWLGKTGLQIAQEGHASYKTEPGRKRGEVEIAEAADQERNPHKAKAMISPRISAKDADYATAKVENLADYDAVRVSTPIYGGQGNLVKMKVRSILIRDVPLEAWVAMLNDPHNPFGGRVEVADPESALSVMQALSRLSIDPEALPEGPVSIVRAAVPFITDVDTRRQVEHHINRFGVDQKVLERTALEKVEELVAFDKELAESIICGIATPEVRRFINVLGPLWNTKTKAIIDGHASNGHYTMTRQLVGLLSAAKQSVVTRQAGMAVGNERFLNQLSDSQRAEFGRIQNAMADAQNTGAWQQWSQYQTEFTRMTAAANIRGGGGCSGDNDMEFGEGSTDPGSVLFNDDEGRLADRKNWKTKIQKCNVPTCPTRPGVVKCGPCGVCMDRCQTMYDRGGDPMMYVAAPKPKQRPAYQFVTKMSFNRPAVNRKALSLI